MDLAYGKRQFRQDIGFNRVDRAQLSSALGVEVLGIPNTKLAVEYRA